MQLTTLLSASAALLATASARSAVEENAKCKDNLPKAKIINRCPYPVHVWSVYQKEIGCDADVAVVLKTGETYQENLEKDDKHTKVGISIKVSKTSFCTQGSIAQLEYYLNMEDPAYQLNFHDVSYVDCQNNDCPTRQEGYYLNTNNGTDVSAANDGSTKMAICPTLSCSNQDECSKMSYVLPDDSQTKSCDQNTDMVWYMCGGEAPGAESYPAPSASSSSSSSSSEEYKEKKPVATPTKEKEAANVAVAAAEVTPAPVEEPKEKKIKTIVEVVTEYVHAKRHAHRHQHFHA